VRLIARGGYNWTKRYPWIAEAALKNRHNQFVIDGEAVVLGVDGVADFNALHSRKHDTDVQLYAFDILALDGDDLRRLPLMGGTADDDLRPFRRAERRACVLRLARLHSADARAKSIALEMGGHRRAQRRQIKIDQRNLPKRREWHA
jgi:hypothetical protein